MKLLITYPNEPTKLQLHNCIIYICFINGYCSAIMITLSKRKDKWRIYFFNSSNFIANEIEYLSETNLKALYKLLKKHYDKTTRK